MRKILNAGLLDLCRDIVSHVKKGRSSSLDKRWWEKFQFMAEEICLGTRTVSPEELAKIEKTIIDAATAFGVKVRREPRGGSQPLACVEETGDFGSGS